MNPIPARQHAPSGIQTYADAADWRAQNISGNIPSDPYSISRYWVDTTAVNSLSRDQDLIKWFPDLYQLTAPVKEYTIIDTQLDGITPIRHTNLDTPQFLAQYAPTMAHNQAVATMRQFKFVYDMLGMPPALRKLVLTNQLAAVPNFNGSPNYPLELRSDHIYFTVGPYMVALPIKDFVERFSPATTDYRSMREAVLTIASNSGITDENAISMIRLAVTDKPKTPPVI